MLTSIIWCAATHIANVLELDPITDSGKVFDMAFFNDSASAGTHHRQVHHQSQRLPVSHTGAGAVVSTTEVLLLLQPFRATSPQPATRGEHLPVLLHLTDEGRLFFCEVPQLSDCRHGAVCHLLIVLATLISQTAVCPIKDRQSARR